MSKHPYEVADNPCPSLTITYNYSCNLRAESTHATRSLLASLRQDGVLRSTLVAVSLQFAYY